MAKIDTSGWKEFLVGELFDVVKGTRLTKANMIPGDIRFIGSSAMNNGCTAMVGNTENMHPANTITVCYNGSVGETFYQDQPFLASDDVNVLYPKFDMTKEIALFIAPLIKSVSARYNYVDKWKQEEMIAGAIKLPVDLSGEPDWAYMDEYMSAVMRESEASLESLRQADERKQMFEISNWKEFPIGGEHGLFDVVKGSRLTKAAMREGTINFISASSFNNGIAAHIANTEHVHPGNTLTVSYNGSDIGRTFYQKEPFWASDDVNVLYPRFELNERIALFLAPLIKEAGGSHVYKNKWLQTDMMNTMIPLPITEGGNPDWDYMDEYMCALLERTDNNLVELQTVI